MKIPRKQPPTRRKFLVLRWRSVDVLTAVGLVIFVLMQVNIVPAWTKKWAWDAKVSSVSSVAVSSLEKRLPRELYSSFRMQHTFPCNTGRFTAFLGIKNGTLFQLGRKKITKVEKKPWKRILYSSKLGGVVTKLLKQVSNSKLDKNTRFPGKRKFAACYDSFAKRMLTCKANVRMRCRMPFGFLDWAKGRLFLNSFFKRRNTTHSNNKGNGGSVYKRDWDALWRNNSQDSKEGRNSLSSKFSDNSLRFRLMQQWTRTPLVTKTFLSLSFSITLFSFLFLDGWPKGLMLDWPAIQRGQLWRLFTGFLYLGNFGISYLLTIHFLWTYMSNLEKLNHATPEEFFIMLSFGMVSLLVAYAILGISPEMLGHNMSSYLVYIWSRIYEGQLINIMDMFQLKAEYLPWYFVLQTYLFEGQAPLFDLVGILFGWIFHWMRTNNVIKSPNFVKQFFARPGIRRFYERYEEEF